MKIHIIDDNEDITTMFSKYFTMKGHTCSVSNDGHNGLNMILTNQFDVVLLDLAIPEFSGRDIVDKLFESDRAGKISIVCLTASLLAPDNEEYLKKRGVHSVLKKPIDPDELLQHLQQFDRKAVHE